MMLYITLLKTNLKREWANKANFLTFILVNIIGYLGEFLFYVLVYQFTDTINGWSKYQVLALFSTIWIVDSLNGGIFHMNTIRIPRYIRDYEMDFFLLKPVPSRWYASMKYVSYGLLAGAPFGVGLLLYSLYQLRISILSFSFLLYFAAVCAAAVVMYNIFFMVTVFSIKYVKLDALEELCWSLLNIGKYPSDIYPSYIKNIFTFVLPVIVIYNFPTDFLLRNQYRYLFWVIAAAVIMTWISGRLWKYLLKFYYA